MVAVVVAVHILPASIYRGSPAPVCMYIHRAAGCGCVGKAWRCTERLDNSTAKDDSPG